jgi:two-component system, OmpR family, sensor histidine kinase KdpD
MNIEHRPDPERILEQIQREERRERSGRLKIFLGYASGVGKSVKMLDEGRRRRRRGEDVVVAAIQAQCTPEIDKLLSLHETIPTSKVSGKDVLDIDRILRRRPQVVLVDGLAYDNPPGSRHAKRWQEIDELLQAGISVTTSINLQYIQEMQEEVASITGKRATETVPLVFLKKADDIEIVDAPAEDEQLSRLREMALLVAAEVVESELRTYLETHDIVENWGIQERILVGITPRSPARPILESGRRNADRFHGDLLVTSVRQPNLSPQDQASLDKNLEIAREVGAEIHVLDGPDQIGALVEFAKKNGITQIFIGHSQQQDRWLHPRDNPVDRLIALAEGIDIRVFPQKTIT